MNKLYHVSTWKDLSSAKAGDSFILKPGPQGAEGPGVYFAEGKPRPSAADATITSIATRTVAIEVESAKGWWRTKMGLCRKFGRARTWHSQGKEILITVEREEGDIVHCKWQWA